MAIKLKKLKKLTGPFPLLTFFLLLVVVLIGFLVVWLYRGSPIDPRLYQYTRAALIQQKQVEKHKESTGCEYGWESIFDYLDKYTVKKGDTLLSIAKNQMGDVSRYPELININDEKYSYLSSYDPFLEIGMTFYLPPKEWPATSGEFKVFKGEVLDIDEQYFYLDNSSSMKVVTKNRFSYNEDTIFPHKKDFVKGDCVVLINSSTRYKTITILIFEQK